MLYVAIHTFTPEEMEERLKAFSTSKKKAHAKSLETTASVWVWKPINEPTIPTLEETEADRKPRKRGDRRFGWEVGNGEDVSHLNKRRQRKRAEKVRASMSWMKLLNNARREGWSQAASSEVATDTAASPTALQS